MVELVENDRDCRRMGYEFEIAMSLSSGRWQNMKKKDRSEKIARASRQKLVGTTSEVSRKYGQIVEKVVSRRTTKGEKRNENRENNS